MNENGWKWTRMDKNKWEYMKMNKNGWKCMKWCEQVRYHMNNDD